MKHKNLNMTYYAENLKFKNLTQCLKSDLAGEGLRNMQPPTMVAQ